VILNADGTTRPYEEDPKTPITLEEYIAGFYTPDEKNPLDLLGLARFTDKEHPMALPKERPKPKTDPKELFAHLGFELDPECTKDKSSWYQRSYDGSCNWLKKGEHKAGAAWTPFQRDVPVHTYADGISKPREGPNPRELSNAFFKQRDIPKLIGHTAFLAGVVELLVHDVSWTVTGRDEVIKVPIPKCDTAFDPNCTGTKNLHMLRSQPVAGTGTSKENPREQVNGVSSFFDAGNIYGTSKETCDKLRSFKNGRLLSQIGPDGREYPPFNTMGLNMVGPRNQSIFAAGDERVNQDWLLMAMQTLLLREHNRLAGIVTQMHPQWDEEKLFQVTRHLMAAKFGMMLNAYAVGYFTEELMGYGPIDDAFTLYRLLYQKNMFQINSMFLHYPNPLGLNPQGMPIVSSHEMSVGYRFHDLLPETLPLKDERNNTIRDINLVDTMFNATGFVDTGLDTIIRGMAYYELTDFRSGTKDAYRNAHWNLRDPRVGDGFDIAAWAIISERERGLPTFNQYMRHYEATSGGKVPSPPRKTWAEFTSNVEWQKKLEELYGDVDKVDMFVGEELDETQFPGTVIPTSQLLTSLFSLFGLGNADRFNLGYAFTHCLLVDKPWDCTPNILLTELLWDPHPVPFFPNARWINQFWMDELDMPGKGLNVLRNMIVKNTDIKCLQKNPFLMPDPVKNPVICEL
jgi:hypothetical protein